MHPLLSEVFPSLTALRRRAIVVCMTVVAFVAPVRAQYFGQNKVQHRRLDFSVIETEHFDIYYYDGERAAAIDGARMAERAYDRLSRLLNHRYRERQPIILYASHSEFQQNNVTTIGEGTGGVTEPYRHRVLLPFTGSYAEFEHVLQHEIVHQFQFDIFAAGTVGAGLQRLMAVNPPLWFMEGLAEYLSLGTVNAQTAMWLKDDVVGGRLPTIEQLTRDPRFTPYRYGHALWSYVGNRWGDESISRILHSASVSGVAPAFQRVLGVSLEELTHQWHAAIESEYRPLLANTQEVDNFALPILTKKRSSGTLHISPSISPDGEYIAYLSEGKWYWIDLYLARAETGRVERRLVKSAFSSEFESLRFLNSAGSWSYDGRLLAFAAKRGGGDDLVMFDVNRNKVVNRIEVPLHGLTTPSWSPDATRLVFTGYDGGISDLFIVNSDGTELRRLTNDKFADLHPVWSPDGRTIAFATDRGPGTDLDRLRMSPLNLATYDLTSGRIEVLPEMSGQNSNPQWAPDGQSIGFVSDRTGSYNLFLFDFGDRRVYQLTDVATGTAGITPLSPAISWATTADRLVFTYYEEDEFNVYGIDDPRSLKGRPYHDKDTRTLVVSRRSGGPSPIDSLDVEHIESALQLHSGGAPNAAPTESARTPESAPSIFESGSLYRTQSGFRPSEAAPSKQERAAVPPTLSVRRLIDSTGLSLPDSTAFTFRGYSHKLSVDYAIQPTIGYVRDNFGGGFFGGSAVSFSDMLGNRRLFLAGMVNGRIDEAQLLATYANLGHRINWAVGAVQAPLFYFNGSFFGSTPDGDEFFTTRYELLVERQAFLETMRPFNRYQRLEFTLRGVSASRSLVDLVQYVKPGTRMVIDAERVNQSIDNAYYFQPSIALVFDNTASLWTGPFVGRRSRFEYAPAFGDWNFHQVLVDYRRYDQLFGPFSLASRLLFFGRFGSDGGQFPIFIGRTDLLRGYTSGSYRRRECMTEGKESVSACQAFQQLTGQRVAVASWELRVPLYRMLGFGSGSIPLPPIETAVFVDVGIAWNRGNELVWKRDEVQQRDMAKYRAPLASWGFSIRSNLYSLFILRADFARPLSREAQGFYWILSFGPTF
jgi:Tol biopolymer transport system component